MGTYTPNLHLYKPDASDPFGEFREKFNDNMDALDNGGGGGSGGHTILDGDGNALPQEDDLQFTGACSVTDDNVNGRTVVDIKGGNVYGAFFDPDRMIYSAFTFDEEPHDWIATEDCILTDNLIPPNENTKACFIQIDGKQVQASYSKIDDPFVYVRKGQTVTYRAKSGSTMKAYGILQGSNGIFAPVIYSDNERVIGIWRDNKPLYAKTWDLGSDLLINSNTWTNTTILVSDFNIENIIQASGLNSGGSFFGFLGANRDQTYVQILQTRNAQITLRYVTLLYTKTTDTAGSGDWTTDGTPTVHYSTSEQVIGTWLDGRPIYQKTVPVTSDIPYNTWQNTGVLVDANADDVINVPQARPQTGSSNMSFLAYFNSGVLVVMNMRNVNYGTNYKYYITVQYTKSTD